MKKARKLILRKEKVAVLTANEMFHLRGGEVPRADEAYEDTAAEKEKTSKNTKGSTEKNFTCCWCGAENDVDEVPGW